MELWNLVWPFLLFVGALAALVKCADIFVEYAERLGARLAWPSMVVGIVVVGVGTSLPELGASIAAVVQGQTEIVPANVIGSNIANICLAFAAASLFGVVKHRNSVKARDLLFLLASTAVAIVFMRDGQIILDEAIVLMLFLVAFFWISLDGGDAVKIKKTKDSLPKIASGLIITGIGVIAFSDLTIRGLTRSAEIIGIGPDVASMVLLAIGTSLPEILVSVAAVRRGNAELALGNVLGSNNMNILGILGLPALFGTLTVSTTSIAIGIPFLAIATGLFLIAGFFPQFRKAEAVVLMALFGAFLVMLF